MRVRPLVAAGLGAVALAGCSSAPTIEVGDCLTNPSADHVRVISCEQSHSGEVVGSYRAEDGPYPGEAALEQQAQGSCAAAFALYVGVPVASSIYDLVPLLPTKNTWEKRGDREILCVVRSTTGESLIGSVRGSAR